MTKMLFARALGARALGARALGARALGARALGLLLAALLPLAALSACASTGQADGDAPGNAPGDNMETDLPSVEQETDPADEERMGYGKILEISDGKLKIEPGSARDRDLYGAVVWVVCSEAEAYSVGQVVTYIFHSVQPPEAEGEPIRIIASVVYME